MPKKKTAGQGDVKMAQAPAKKRGRPAGKAAAPKSSVIIDYPLEGEIVTSASYTIRLTASEPDGVELSFDGREWLPARESVGHWWYDWSAYQAGAHTLSARMRTAAGKVVKAKPRQFTVLI